MNVSLKDRKKEIVFILMIFLMYLIAMVPVLRSGYMYDDLYNYTARGYSMLNNMSLWEMTKNSAYEWFSSKGRTFFFIWYPYIFFDMVGLRFYKFLTVVLTFINGLLFGEIIDDLTEKKDIKWICILLFPIMISLDCSFYNAMYGFCMLQQLVCLFSFTGIMSYTKYIKSTNYKWQILSCTCLFISLGIYEVSYVLCLIYLIIGMYYKKKFLKFFRTVIPQFIIGCLWVGLTVLGRIQATGEYAGTSINLGWESFEGFLRQLSGATCITNIFLNLPNISVANIQFSNIVRYFVIVCGMIGVFVLLWSKGNKVGLEESSIECLDSVKRQKVLFWIGFSILVVPSLLTAVSQRWQREVIWGKGYLPAYVACWGGTLLVAIFINWIKENVKKIEIPLVFVGLLVLMIGIPNQIIGDMTVNATGNWSYIADDLFMNASETGIFDEIEENEVIVDGILIWSGAAQHYTQLLEKKINAYNLYELFSFDGSVVTHNNIYDELNKKASFKYFTMPNECSCLIMAKCESIFIDYLDGNLAYVPKGKAFYVYIPNDRDYSTVTIYYDNGSMEQKNLSSENFIAESKEGKSYHILLNENVNINTVCVQ